MSNEETNNETELLAILGGDRPTLFETQFVSMRCVLNSEEYSEVKRLLTITVGIKFPYDVLTLLRSEVVLESLSRYDGDKQSSDLRSALAKIRATVDLMGEVRMSF